MAFLPPKKPRPVIPRPSDEEAEFLLWLASRQRPASRNDRFPYYFPGTGTRSPYAPGAPADAVEGPAVQAPEEPAAALPPQPAGKTPTGWTPAYRGLLTPPEPRGLLDLPQGAQLPPPSLSAGLALAAAFAPQPQPPQPQPPRTTPGGWTPPGYRGLLSGPRGLPDRKEDVGPGMAPALLPGPPVAPTQTPQVPLRWGAPPAAPALPPRSAAVRGTQIAQSNLSGRSWDSIPAPRPKPPVPRRHDIYAGVPEYKRDYFRNNDQGQNWVDFIQATGFLPQVSTAEKMIYREIFAAEGGNVPDGETVAGVTKKILPDLVRTGDLPDSFGGKLPKDLTQQERAQVYRAYMNNAFQHVSGYRTLEEIENPALAAFVADTVFREGAPEGNRLIHKVLNEALGKRIVSEDAKFRREDVELLNRLTPHQRNRFAKYLANARAEIYLGKRNYEGEKGRAEYFRDRVTDGD